MKKPDTLLIASGNRQKIAELGQMLKPLGIRLVSTLDYPDAGGEVVEDLDTLEGNALKKAREWHERTGLPALADDTGLEVRALDGAPGVHSARYAGPDAEDRDIVEKLLRELEQIQELQSNDDRSARFRTVVALVGLETGGQDAGQVSGAHDTGQLFEPGVQGVEQRPELGRHDAGKVSEPGKQGGVQRPEPGGQDAEQQSKPGAQGAEQRLHSVKGTEKLFEGICEGEILTEPAGERGFGYDPIFRPKGYEKSFAELTAKEKNKISHRGLALKEVITWLEGL